MSSKPTTTIPPITDPLGLYWEQPSREAILIDERNAIMASADWKRLHQYDCSVPSGTYIGKMWGCTTRTGERLLRWYDKIVGDMITIESRVVIQI